MPQTTEWPTLLLCSPCALARRVCCTIDFVGFCRFLTVSRQFPPPFLPPEYEYYEEEDDDSDWETASEDSDDGFPYSRRRGGAPGSKRRSSGGGCPSSSSARRAGAGPAPHAPAPSGPPPIDPFLVRYTRQLARPVMTARTPTTLTLSLDRRGEAEDVRVKGKVCVGFGWGGPMSCGWIELGTRDGLGYSM